MRRLGLLLLVMLAACSQVTTGTVVDKRHEDMRIWYDSVADYAVFPVSQCYGTGTTRSCSTTYQQRIVGYHNEQRIDDEDWVLVLENKEGERGEVEVDEDTYNRMERGSWYGEKE